jgi:hypothetical protein
MFDFATAWLIQYKVLLPGATTLTRLISKIRDRVANRLWLRLSSLPTDEQKAKLETLLQVPDEIIFFDKMSCKGNYGRLRGIL